jgi:hypothetical protein
MEWRIPVRESRTVAAIPIDEVGHHQARVRVVQHLARGPTRPEEFGRYGWRTSRVMPKPFVELVERHDVIVNAADAADVNRLCTYT